MQIPILIERISPKRFRARGCEPLALSAEGPTPEAALAKLKEQLQARLRNGAEIVPLELETKAHPLAEFAGMFNADFRRGKSTLNWILLRCELGIRKGNGVVS
jgi:hypothetical protein